jgi:hypothetical protein
LSSRSSNYGQESPTTSKTLSLTGEVGHDFLFAIKWPNVNYPPSLPPGKSLVHTEYVLRAFLQLSNGERLHSEPLNAEFRPHIDPGVVIRRSSRSLEKRESIVKDEDGRVVAEASLICTDGEGIIFGGDCPLNLNLLVRQSESKPLPRKAKIEICEVHKCTATGKQQVLLLSQETIALPGILRPHQETSIPLKVKIPVPEIDDTRKGATGLPTLTIGSLQVEYMIKITVFLSSSRLPFLTKKEKVVAVDCPIVVGNVKPRPHKSARKIPVLVVNVEGEGLWESHSTTSSTFSREHIAAEQPIVEWSPDCEIPKFLAGEEAGEDDIL